MKTRTRLIILSLGLALNTVALADDNPGASHSTSRPATTQDSSAAMYMDQVDRYLLEALQAKDESARKVALQSAQTLLDAMGVNSETMPPANPVSGKTGDWLSDADRSLDRLQQQTGKGLRESLMYKIWASPYGAISGDTSTALETVSDALRLLREVRRVDAGNDGTVEHLQSTYWDWLMAYRQSTSLDQMVISKVSPAPVFGLRALREKDGAIQLYQLTGTDDYTLRWTKAAGRDVPSDLLTSDALTVNLSRETAPWLLVVEGEGLATHLVAHRFWLEAIDREVRLVLMERGDYAVTLRGLPAEWFGSGRRMPYVLRGKSSDAKPQLHLVHVTDAQVVVSWPLGSLDGPAGPAIKDLINHVLATASAR